jgi:DNA polymerase (family X)
MSKGVRIPLSEAKIIADDVMFKLEVVFGVKSTVAGSILRERPTVADVDLVITQDDYDRIKTPSMRLDLEKVFDEAFYTQGSKKSPSRLTGGRVNGTIVELYVAKHDQFYPMLLFATGSGKFNVRMRQIAKSKGFKLSQYGLFNGGSLPMKFNSEKEIFDVLGMKYLEPKEREEG